jgi:hypothetical protein
MYYIYHIPGVKIGCSTNPKRRVEKQGYCDFELLESHTDIEVAAKREKELQSKFGYVEKNIATDYVQQYEFGKIGREKAKGKGAKAQIENKIGMFSYSKEERLRLNTKANIIRAKISAEKRSVSIDMFDFKNGNYIKSFKSIKDCAIEINGSGGNIGAVLNGYRSQHKGYTFKLSNEKN